MTTDVLPTWIRYSERAFAVNFVAFSFVMFSCWFTTGFSATFSTLAFVFALPVFFFRMKALFLNKFEKTGLVLFLWLAASVLWSTSPFKDSLDYLGEYRLYFIVPIFTFVLAFNPEVQRYAFRGAVFGAIAALLASYALGFGLLHLEGAHLSLADHIYHGFIMSCLLAVCLVMYRESVGWRKLLVAILASAVFYNVLAIEQGRTGYLQIISVCATLAFLNLSRIRAMTVVGIIVSIVLLSYLVSERLQHRIDLTVRSVQALLVDPNYESSLGMRVAFYSAAIDIGFEHPLTGVGVGDVTKELRDRAESGQMPVLTDNVHSEFLNMFVAGGLPAFFLFVCFLGSIFYTGFIVRRKCRQTGDFFIALGVVVLISALFNSTVKDYGEKHALIIMLSILGGRLAGLIRQPDLR